MDFYMMRYNYQSEYLVVINENTYVSVYRYEKYKFDQTFLYFKQKLFLLMNQRFVV